MKQLIQLLVLIILPTISFSQSYTLKDKDVYIANGYIQSCSYNFENKEIIIPSVLNGQTVIGIEPNEIERGVFNNKGIRGISLPTTLKVIGSYAFSNNSLIEISLPSSVEEVQEGAFSNNEIVSFEIHPELKVIGHAAFSKNKITSLELKNTVNTIAPYAFADNQIENLIIESGIDTLNMYLFASNKIREVVLPASLKNLKKGVFSNNPIETLLLPHNTDPYFSGWVNSTGQVFQGGDQLNALDEEYRSIKSYTLLDDDVVIENGEITSVNFEEIYNHIIIPETLNGQTVIKIADKYSLEEGVFAFKGLNFIQLPQTLESIGRYAFTNNQLLGIDIPNSVTSIGVRAFWVNHLTYINYSDNIEFLGKYCFSSNDLTEVRIPSKIKVLERDVFSYNKISKIHFNEVLETIGIECFYHNQLEELILPESVKRVLSSGFSFNRLEKVTFPEKLKILDVFAFNSNNLSEINLPSEMDSIMDHVFLNNPVKTFKLPKHINPEFIIWYDSYTETLFDPDTEISTSAKGYVALINKEYPESNFIVEDGYIKYVNLNSWYNKKLCIKIPEKLHGETIIGIGTYVFAGDNIYGISLPNTIKEIKEHAFEGNYLRKVVLPQSLEKIEQGAFRNNLLREVVFLTDKLTKIEKNVFRTNKLKTINLPSSIQHIGDNAFSHNHLQSLTLEENITSLSSNAFDFNKIEELSIPRSIKEIPYACFRNNNLKTLNIPHITTIDSYAFSSNDLTEIQLPENLRRINSKAFYDNPIKEYKLPLIEDSLFVEWIDINRKLSIPIDSLIHTNTDYDQVAFFRYSVTINDVKINDNYITGTKKLINQPHIHIPKSIGGTEIFGIKSDNWASPFVNQWVKSVTLEEGILELGQNAFKYLGLESVELPSTIHTIGNSAFSSNKLNEIDLPEHLSFLGVRAFEKNNLTKVKIPISIKNIPFNCFNDNLINEVDFHESINEFEPGCFSNNQLEHVVLPQNTIKVGYKAFDNNKIKYIVLTKPISKNFVEWNGYDDEFYEHKFYSAKDTIYRFDKTYTALFRKDLIQDYATINNDTLTSYHDDQNGIYHLYCSDEFYNTKIKVLGNSVFGSEIVRSIYFDEGLLELEKKALKGIGLIDIQLPSTLKIIGEESLANNELDSIFLPESIEFIAGGAFLGNNFDSFNLPIINDPDFLFWSDDRGNELSNGAQVSDFISSYIAVYVGDVNLEKPTSIYDKSLEQLIVYPNPTNGKLQIKNLKKDCLIQIYNTQGKLLQNEKISTENQLNIEGQPGVYILKVITEHHSKTFKVIKN
ncbi:leucine-rich repeat protein [Flammeovirga pacifica]|uniref:leucine-rich repeat protein n=1 Tax=Flammeovirga pacifica TaxID=915059 RepID=UPI0013011674|nr:leucine-rich repeat protein [Flammeovirga pacifica]